MAGKEGEKREVKLNNFEMVARLLTREPFGMSLQQVAYMTPTQVMMLLSDDEEAEEIDDGDPRRARGWVVHESMEEAQKYMQRMRR